MRFLQLEVLRGDRTLGCRNLLAHPTSPRSNWLHDRHGRAIAAATTPNIFPSASTPTLHPPTSTHTSHHRKVRTRLTLASICSPRLVPHSDIIDAASRPFRGSCKPQVCPTWCDGFTLTALVHIDTTENWGTPMPVPGYRGAASRLAGWRCVSERPKVLFNPDFCKTSADCSGVRIE